MLPWYEFAALFICFIFSSLIGIYFGCFGTRQKSTNEYLQGDRKMGFFTIGISVAVSHFSGVTLIGASADLFRYGNNSVVIPFGFIFVVLAAVYVYLPVFFKLQLPNAYDYLELRFDRRTKILVEFLYVFSEIVFFPILVYLPAASLSVVSGINVNIIAVTACLCCIFYTTIGGLKTVIWTDIFQFTIIVISVSIISVLGSIEQGFASVWKTGYQGERMSLDFRFDPTLRNTFWSNVVSYNITVLSAIITHQTGVQKFLAVRNFKACIWSVIYSVISKAIVLYFVSYIGLLIYSKYAKCDPLVSRQIQKHDHIVPFYVKEIAGHIPGVIGIFIASIFCASFGSMSSLLNSLSTVIYQDCVCNIWKGASNNIKALKLTVVTVGIFCTLLVFLVEHLGQVLPLTMVVRGAVYGPMLGVFTLGMVFPKAKSAGAFFGGLFSLIFFSILMIISKYFELTKGSLYPVTHLSVSNCSDSLNITIPVAPPQINNIPAIFKVSFYHYTWLGSAVTIILGLVISFFKKGTTPVNRDLISPIFHFLLPPAQQNKDYELVPNRNNLTLEK